MIISLKDARYQTLRSLFGPLVSEALVPTEIVGQRHLPEQGPALIVANHRSVLDPYLFSARSKRTVNWVMAPFVAQIPLFGWLAKEAGAISLLTRGSGKAEALMAAMEGAWRQGRLVGIFPEGMDAFVAPTASGEVGRFHGTFMRAVLKAKIPDLRIIPVAVYSREDTRLGDMPDGFLSLFDRSEKAFRQGGMSLVGYKEALIVVGKGVSLAQDYGLYHHPEAGEEEPLFQKQLVAERCERLRQAVVSLMRRAEEFHHLS